MPSRVGTFAADDWNRRYVGGDSCSLGDYSGQDRDGDF
jgi:hypothetical protein